MAESSNRNNMGTPVPPGMIARITQAARYVVAGVTPESWFGPLQPMAPIAQEKAVGRAFDYDTGFNLRQNPKQAEGFDFGSLRALADGYDLLRLVIETRKDQISAMPYSFKPTDSKKDGEGDARIDMLTKFFASPDKENTWSVWLRALVEDLLVIDAPTIYPRKTVGGDIYALELMDGAIIKRVIDEQGRTPLPPSPAYQQVLKGLPAVDYTRETLIYSPRNIRTNKVYGFSPVEQVQMTVNIALRRQLSQLQYYTDGSTPDLIFGVPDTWQPDQIKQFQEWWDSVLAGNTQARRGTRFVPGGLNPLNTKDQVLKDMYDEWLARIVCFAFSISPQALSMQMNRATAETAAQTAHEEGLMPLMQWVKDLINHILVQCFGITDITFHWNTDESVDALTQSQIDCAYVAAKIKDPNEVRDKLGLAALTPEQDAKLNPPPIPPDRLVPPGGQPGSEPLPDATKGAYLGQRLGKARAGRARLAKARTVPAIKRDRPAVTACLKGVSKAIKKWQKAARVDMTRQALELFTSRKGTFLESLPTHADAHKAEAVDTTDAEIEAFKAKALDEIRKALDVSEGITTLYGDIDDVLAAMAADGAAEALIQIGMNDAPEVTLDLVNQAAVDWAAERAAEMVGMKMVNGELVPNPDAAWVITDTQREDTAQLVVTAMEEGWSNDRLSKELSDASAYSESRADMIARTETAMADVQGNMAAYRNSSVVSGKEWILGDEACEDCVANSEVGSIGLFDLFPSGDDGPPAHPNCRCDILPTVIEDGPSSDDAGDDAE
jgi:hypothetical protein